VEAIEVAERIRSRIEQYIFMNTSGEPFRITISIGLFTVDGSQVVIDERITVKKSGYILVGQADNALYKAKS